MIVSERFSLILSFWFGLSEFAPSLSSELLQLLSLSLIYILSLLRPVDVSINAQQPSKLNTSKFFILLSLKNEANSRLKTEGMQVKYQND